jgi:outer membrane protein OmpA-like peptidoglycan-associated protein
MKMFPVKSSAVIGIILPFALFANDLNNGGQTGTLRTLSATTLGKTGFDIGIGFKYATDAAYVKGPNGSGNVVQVHDSSESIITNADPAELLSTDFYAAFGLTDIWDVSVNLPLYEDISGWGPTSGGMGDIEFATKLTYPYQVPNAFMSQAYYLKVIFPTGRKLQGYFPRHSYYIQNNPNNSGINAFSVEAVFYNPMLAWTFDFSRLPVRIPILFHANFGGVIAKAKSGSAVMAALGIELRASPIFTLFTEITGESRVKYYADSFSVASFVKDPFRLSFGFRMNLPGGFYCLVADDIGFSEDITSYRANWNRNGYRYSTKAIPRWSGQINIGWAGRVRAADSDRDGIPDSVDKCKKVPEDKDGYNDDDGCPDFDNDKDGIPDTIDKCPNVPEDKDGYSDNDGCPDFDNDKDGVPDSLDKCPNVPEDIDGFEDGDGCPDFDNDKDGVPDSLDKCLNAPEDVDGFEDKDGCPDLDNDKDGVPDSLDKCPAVAGTADNNGCPPKPKAEEVKRRPLILNGVMFEGGKAELTEASLATLDQVAQSLLEWSKVKIEVRGYSDNKGNEAANLRMSQLRAEAVRDYLIKKGVAPDRLTATGCGSNDPIASNATVAGRQRNRRVELHRRD